MIWGKSHLTIKDRVNNPKNLRDYTDEELYRFLEKNEDVDTGVLACICSEILRRQLKPAERTTERILAK